MDGRAPGLDRWAALLLVPLLPVHLRPGQHMHSITQLWACLDALRLGPVPLPSRSLAPSVCRHTNSKLRLAVHHSLCLVT
jgi:hypothetical protein